MTAEPVRLGADGTGGYARTPLDAAQRSGRLQIVACFDPDERAAAEAAERYGCRPAASYEELLADDGVEAILSNTPNFVHRDHALAAAAAGKHFYVAKPIANRVAEAREMVNRFREMGLVLMVGHQTRRHPSFRRMRALIEQGAIGTALQAEANFSHAGGMRLTPEKWRADRTKCPACPMMQLGVHCADTLLYLLGPATRATGLMKHQATPVDIDDLTAVLFEFECGALGYIGSNYASPAVYYINVYGTEANLLGTRETLTIRWADGRTEQPELPQVDVYVEEVDDFARAIREGCDPEVTGEAGLAALALVEGCLRSAEEGRTLEMRELAGGSA